MTSEIYKEQILELYRYPHNKGKLNNFTHEFKKNNPVCGDEITIQLIVKNNKIENVKFSGEGCAISQASASLITDKIKNLSTDEINRLSKKDVLDLLKIPISYARLNCALLPLDAIKMALKNA